MSVAARFRLPYPGFTLDVDLDLPGRGVTALFGPSGSGKTTLLRCIAGLEHHAQGRLTVDGERWQDDGYFLPVHRRPIGYVFQEARLFPHLTVQRNLDFGQRRVAPAQRRVSSDHAVELLGIGHLLERLPGRLSGGERQRVAIARALLTSPRLLLMDEPLAALDLARKNEILPYLERLHDELEIPLLYVSHAPDEVARLADHIVVMEAGRAVAQGALADTLARLDPPVRLGDDAGVVLDGCVAERDENWHLARIAEAGPRSIRTDNGRCHRMKDIRIDFATASDLPAMADLLAELFSLEADFRPDRDKQLRGLRLILDTPEIGRLFVARAGNEVVGMANALITVSTAQGSRVLLLEDVVLRKDQRGGGLGRKLVEHVCAWAKAQGMTRVTLLADKDNAPALGFYERLGFEPSAMVVRRRTL